MRVAGLRRRLLAASAGLVLDLRFGEPALQPHPVAAFGTAMGRFEDRAWRDSRAAGVAHLGVGALLALAVARVAPSTTLATALAVAGRALADEAARVGDLLAGGDLAGAREALPALVGRDPSALDETGVARAVVESVAENSVDAVVATALWAVAGGAPGALVHRAVNTMDAMVGHRDARHLRYGWASARADDAMAWVPARVAAALVAAVRPTRALAVARTVRRDAGGHPSPNGGVAEAAFAAALGLRLGGTENRYGEVVDARPPLGDGRDPAPLDVARANALLRDVTLALAAVLALAALALPGPRRR